MNTIGFKSIDLVFHQGDERGDDDSDAFAEQCGELVAERFAASCGKQSEDVLTRQGFGDYFFLERAKLVVAEVTFKNVSRSIHWVHNRHFGNVDDEVFFRKDET